MDERVVLWGLIVGLSVPSLYGMGALDRLPGIGSCARLERRCDGARGESATAGIYCEAALAHVARTRADASRSSVTVCEVLLSGLDRAGAVGYDKALVEAQDALKTLQPPPPPPSAADP